MESFSYSMFSELSFPHPTVNTKATACADFSRTSSEDFTPFIRMPWGCKE